MNDKIVFLFQKKNSPIIKNIYIIYRIKIKITAHPQQFDMFFSFLFLLRK